MVKGQNSRVTARDISLAGSLEALIAKLIKEVSTGDMETKEHGTALLRSLTEQHKSDADTEPDNAVLIGKKGGIRPLLGVVASGSPLGRTNACAALANICRGHVHPERGSTPARSMLGLSPSSALFAFTRLRDDSP